MLTGRWVHVREIPGAHLGGSASLERLNSLPGLAPSCLALARSIQASVMSRSPSRRVLNSIPTVEVSSNSGVFAVTGCPSWVGCWMVTGLPFQASGYLANSEARVSSPLTTPSTRAMTGTTRCSRPLRVSRRVSRVLMVMGLALVGGTILGFGCSWCSHRVLLCERKARRLVGPVGFDLDGGANSGSSFQLLTWP